MNLHDLSFHDWPTILLLASLALLAAGVVMKVATKGPIPTEPDYRNTIGLPLTRSSAPSYTGIRQLPISTHSGTRENLIHAHQDSLGSFIQDECRDGNERAGRPARFSLTHAKTNLDRGPLLARGTPATGMIIA